MESLGGFHPGCNDFAVFLGKALADVNRVPRGIAIRKLRQTISFTWQKKLGYALMAERQALFYAYKAEKIELMWG
jgi:hypothetical protein